MVAEADGDHPRSRGVYGGPVSDGDGGAGIIPARAGFTAAGRWAVRAVPDHPRSRGVYALVEDWQESSPGSSPLARGLQRAS